MTTFADSLYQNGGVPVASATGLFPAPELFNGKTYYVDYETGSDTSGTGEIDKPYKQVNAAITASNAYTTGANQGATGDVGYVRRNAIYVRPFAPAATSLGQYDPITVIPHQCDIIGCGAGVLSNGSGVVAIGSSTDATAALTVGSAGMRGTRFFNIQFRGGGTSTNVFVATGTVMRCSFIDCSFYSLNSTNAHISATGNFAGNVFKNCYFTHNEGGTKPLYNIYLGAGVMTDNVFENCRFAWATTNNVYVGAGQCHGSSMVHCIFGQEGTPAVSFHDHSQDGGIFLAECYFDADASDPIERTTAPAGNDAGCIKGKTLITGSE